jgi:hypothetical protein
MRYKPEELLRKTVQFDEDVTVDKIVFFKGLQGYITADINDILAITLYDVVEGLDSGWVTFKDMTWIRDKFSIVEG